MTKRPWEEAKAEYRASLKQWQLKNETHYSAHTIERALEIVHEDRMKAKEHVELAKSFIPRLDGLVQKLVDNGLKEVNAFALLKKTYRRTNEVMISAEDHLQAALAETK